MKLDEISTLLAAATFKLPLRTSGLHDDAHGPGLHGICSIEDAEGERVVICDSGIYPPTKPDADLIVALVNAAPQLLAIARAAQAVRAEWLGSNAGTMTVTTPMFEALNDLAKALQEAG